MPTRGRGRGPPMESSVTSSMERRPTGFLAPGMMGVAGLIKECVRFGVFCGVRDGVTDGDRAATEGFAETLGLPVRVIGLGLVIASAIAAVAAFDAVGSIIVIAMFICPPAAARLMTNRLEHQVWWSVAFATLSAILGYVLAGYGPLWFGARNAVSAAGMIAAVSGVILGLACLYGPHRNRVGVGRQEAT